MRPSAVGPRDEKLTIVPEEVVLKQKLEAAEKSGDNGKIKDAKDDLKYYEEHHIPHLLDFHNLFRPECMTFWIIMVACFCYGFVPAGKKQNGK